MGKGDKKTRRGKISMGSYGVKRKRKKSHRPINNIPAAAIKPKATTRAKKTVSAESSEVTPKKVTQSKKASEKQAKPAKETKASKAAPKKTTEKENAKATPRKKEKNTNTSA